MADSTETPPETTGTPDTEKRLQPGTIPNVLLAFVVIVAAWWIDDRREDRTHIQTQELAWRELIRPNAELPGLDLTNLTLDRLYAPGADLSGSLAAGADLRYLDLTGGYLDAGDLTRTNLHRANLTNTGLPGANLTRARVTDARLDHADLRSALLYRTDLRGTTMWRTDLRGTDLRRARITRDQVGRTCWDEHTQWPTGHEPDSPPLCNENPPRPPAKATHYTIDAVIGPTDNTAIADHHTVTGDHVTVHIHINNIGRARRVWG